MIEAFRQLYKDRKSMDAIQTIEAIRTVIKSELLDEFTHPRARQSIEKKYALALERIKNSNLSINQKQMILDAYFDEYTKLSTEYEI
ncbi:hypothetical protein MHH81_08145 [Psychrobacillus sp. FSL H8-0484]|uniref:hypothetical protein n=1 Tax=Psychrobacillus sp. FSL H8-0484 TaxID=2921390 RepID=UPI0030FA1C89